MKKITTLILVFVSVLCLFTACDGKTGGSKEKLPETAGECISVYKEAHTDDGASLDITIPNLSFDTEAAKSINAEILSRFYTSDVKTAIDGGFTNIGIYITPKASLYGTILSLQINETYTPSYGTDGDVYLVCYDVQTHTELSAAYVLSKLGYDYETAEAQAYTFAKQEYGALEYFEMQGVYVYEDGSCDVVSYAVPEHVGTDAWKSVSVYKLSAKE